MAVDTRATEAVIEPDVEAPPLLDRLYRLSVEQYDRMTEVGILGPDDRVELLEGVIIKKMTKNSPHMVASTILTQLMVRILPDGWFLSVENPVSIPERASEPEPDAQVVRGHHRDYLVRKPGPRDVGLFIEIAESSYPEDRGRKWALYARSSVPVYWIVNLNARRLEVYSDPTGEAEAASYRQARSYGSGDEVPLVLDGREVARLAVSDLLP